MLCIHDGIQLSHKKRVKSCNSQENECNWRQSCLGSKPEPVLLFMIFSALPPGRIAHPQSPEDWPSLMIDLFQLVKLAYLTSPGAWEDTLKSILKCSWNFVNNTVEFIAEISIEWLM